MMAVMTVPLLTDGLENKGNGDDLRMETCSRGRGVQFSVRFWWLGIFLIFFYP